MIERLRAAVEAGGAATALAKLLGFRLHHVVETTDLSASAAERLQPWHELGDGINAANLQAARNIVEQIRQDLAAPASGGSG